MTALIVMAKAPRAGASKTRLSPPLSHDQAARVAAAALFDTLGAVARTPVSRRVLAIDGEPGALGEGVEVVSQRGAGLADRLASAFEDVGGRAVLIGMDTPQVQPPMLTAAVDALDDNDAVLGEALDGGWWLLGLRTPDRRVFEGVPMSSSTTCRSQRERLDDLGLRTAEVAMLRDVDRIDDARAVAESIPSSMFARALAATGEWHGGIDR